VETNGGHASTLRWQLIGTTLADRACRLGYSVGGAIRMILLSKPVALLAYISVLVSACAPVGYIKPEMTEEGVNRDLSECAEIARHQAFRDNPFMDIRYDALHHRDWVFHRHTGPSRRELKYRYRRVFMLARGYRFAPLDDPITE
jgi:hypothetical protein